MPADRQRSRPVPSSTYRIQFSKDQTFDQVRELLPYLDALGAGALYASPLLESGAGSNHGYDVVDPTPDLRGARRAGRAARARGRRPRARAGLRARHRAQPRRRRGLAGEPVVVGRAAGRQGVGVRGVLRHRLGRGADPAPGAGRGRGEGARRELALSDDGTELRYYEHAAARWRRAPRAAARRRCTSASTTGSALAARRGRADLPAFLRRVDARRVRVEDPEVFAATHAEMLRWVAGARSTACASTTPTGWPSPAATCAGCGPRSGRTAGWWSRRSSSPARSCPGLAGRRARPATRRCARSTACSSTRMARRPSPQSPPSTPAARAAAPTEHARGAGHRRDPPSRGAPHRGAWAPG